MSNPATWDTTTCRAEGERIGALFANDQRAEDDFEPVRRIALTGEVPEVIRFAVLDWLDSDPADLDAFWQGFKRATEAALVRSWDGARAEEGL